MPTILSKRRIKIGPDDHGRRMPLADFDLAEVVEGYLYELGRGVIEVSDIPQPEHGLMLQAIRDELGRYRLAHPDRIFAIFGGADCKILIPGMESERHPDISVYSSEAPEVVGSAVWSVWIPSIVIEVLSPSSRVRDFSIKREEYLAFGVREYWIVDGERREILILRRFGDVWREQVVKAIGSYRTPLLPEFVLNARKVFSRTKKPR